MTYPQEWLDVLRTIQGVFPGAIIAGGALRDTILGGPVKDVDIFIPITEDYVGNIGNAFEAISFMYPDATIDSGSIYVDQDDPEANRDIHAVMRLLPGIFPEDRQFAYDLILCPPETARIDTFDLNICQIKFDGEHTQFTGDFVHGFITNTLKVLNVNRSDRNKARIDRILAKYPDMEYNDE